MNLLRWVSVVAGVICGFLSTHFLNIGWLNLILWAIVGMGIGGFVFEKREAIWSGALYGFFLSISFLLSGFQGASDKFLDFVLFSLALSMVGVVGGTVSVFMGSWLRKRF